MITMQSHSDWKYTMALLKRPLFWRWVGLIIAIEWNKKKKYHAIFGTSQAALFGLVPLISCYFEDNLTPTRSNRSLRTAQALQI